MSKAAEVYNKIKDEPQVKEFIQYCKEKGLSYEEVCCALLGADQQVQKLQLEVDLLTQMLVIAAESSNPKPTEEKLH